MHHPFDDFETTVVRFLREAAADPHVTTIKITLYRAGDPSAVVDALLAAARAGKKVVALDRAQGALRRGAQRQLGARARGGRRTRDLRLRRTQGAREDRARRASRRRRAAAIRARRHGELQHALRPPVHRPQPVLRVRCAHLRRGRPVQRAHAARRVHRMDSPRRARRAGAAAALRARTDRARDAPRADGRRPRSASR